MGFGESRFKKRRKSGRFSGRLPDHVEALMGDANTCYMQGDFDAVRPQHCWI
jgi:hypothetical protein